MRKEMNARRLVKSWVVSTALSRHTKRISRPTTRKKDAPPDRRFMAEWRRVKKASEPNAAVKATSI
jgi:hypothetical protein